MAKCASPVALSSRLGRLLFWQVCLLAAIAGILAQREPGPGLLLLLLVWLLDLPRIAVFRRSIAYLLIFVCAFVYAFWRDPSPGAVPEWAQEAAYAQRDADDNLLRPGPTRVSGTVREYAFLPGNRLRIILDGVRPVPLEGKPATAQPISLVWNWKSPSFTPLPGERLEATLRLSPVRGMRNPGVWDVEEHWADRGVFFRGWAVRQADVRRLDFPDAGSPPSLAVRLAASREELRLSVLRNLPVSPAKEGSVTAVHEEPALRLTEAAALLPALLFNDRSHLSHAQTDLFARATLAHSLALSGLHLGFCCLAGLVLARGFGCVCAWLGVQPWLRLPRLHLAMLLALPFAGLYLWLGQAPISLMRAAAMLFFWTVLLLLHRPGLMLDGLFAALGMLLLSEPLVLFEVSLQLSALCIAAIALTTPYLYRVAQRLFPAKRADTGKRRLGFRFCRWAFMLLGISLCIQVALLPLTARVFGSSGLLFPLNLLWLPLLGTVVLPLAFLGLGATALGLHSCAAGLFHTALLPGEALLALLHWLDATGWLLSPVMPRPHWLSAAGFWLLLLALPVLVNSLLKKQSWRRRGDNLLWVGAGVLLLLLPPVWSMLDNRRQSVCLRLLDVGQGQAALVEWTGIGPDKAHGRVLIDGGGFASDSFDVGKSIIAPALTDNALPQLDAVIASHPDVDHLGGLLFILAHFQVKQYLTNGSSATPALAAREQKALRASSLVPRTLTAGTILPLTPGLQLEVLWPDAETQAKTVLQPSGKEKSNNASLVLRLVWEGQPLALLCGDIEPRGIRQLLRNNTALTANALILPHHGSSGSFNKDFYDAVGPSLALASCGYGNRWGFPAAKVRKELRAAGVPLLDTATSGQILLDWRSPDGPPAVSEARGR